MKKLARLTALLLTGALLLVLTACGAVAEPEPETEQQAKQRLLEEINSYRASHEPSLAPLVEVKLLSDAQQIRVAPFRTANTTVLPDSETNEAWDEWLDMTVDDWTFRGEFGLDWTRVDDVPIHFLTAMVPANTPKGNKDLQAALRSSGKFDYDNCKSIGIAVVTIKGQMYWTCTMFKE